jgi:hypothetical protein
MAPRKGILPRSIKERYHQSRHPEPGPPPEPAHLTPDARRPEPEPRLEPATAPPEPEPPPEPRPPSPPRHLAHRALALAGLVGAILACAAIGIVLGSVVSSAGDDDRPQVHTRTLRTQPPPVRTTRGIATPQAPIELEPGGAYDPLGDGTEHADVVPLAIDGDPASAWSSEDYQALNKPGVGFYVNPERPASPTRATIRTPTPGFSAQILGSGARTAPQRIEDWTELGRVATVRRVKGVALDPRGRTYRHVLLWITSLPPSGGAVRISELTLH